MKRYYLFATIALLLLAFSSSDMFGQREKSNLPSSTGILGFIVDGYEGKVITRAPFGVGWKQVIKGKFIPDNNLVQVTKNSRVDLYRAEMNRDTNIITRIPGESSGIKIDTPAIIRTGPRLIRHIELSRYFVEEMPKIAQRLLNKNPDWYLDEAWKRVAAFFSGRSTITNAASQGTSDQSTAQATGNLQKINLLSPASGSYLERDRFPTDLNVAWTVDSKDATVNTKYKIYLWRAGESRKDPVALTSGDSYRLSVDQAGEYLVQVERDDGKAISNPHKVIVADRRTDKIAKISGTKQIELDAKLSTPAMSENILSNRGKTPVRFSWRLFFPADGRLTLVVSNSKQTVLRESVGQKLSSVRELPVGSYTWRLVWEIKAGLDGRTMDEAASEVNSFSISTNDSKNLVSKVGVLLQGSNKNAGKTVLFVDQW